MQAGLSRGKVGAWVICPFCLRGGAQCELLILIWRVRFGITG